MHYVVRGDQLTLRTNVHSWPALLKLEFHIKKMQLQNQVLLTVLVLFSFPGQVPVLYCRADQIFSTQIHVA